MRETVFIIVDNALAAIGSVEWVLVDIEIDNDSDSDTGEEEAVWQMIPAENLIAAAQYTGTKIAFCVSRSQDVIGLSNALELGVDALCIKQGLSSYDDPDLWKSVFQARIERNNAIEKDLVDGKSSSADDGNSINKYKPQITIGSCWRRDTTSSLSSSSSSSIIADRICIDFVQTLKEEEGCWIGSSSKIMALILSENSPSEYVPTRPFRVNAGPVHSYILMGDEKETIKYLCELMAADSVSVYNTVTKTSRSIIIGRIKQEIRPCIIVELEQTTPKEVAMISSEIYTINGNDDDYSGEIDRSSSSSKRQQLLPSSSGQIFLQQAETVRLGQKDGNYIRATDLKVLQSSSSQSQSQQQQVAVNNSKSDRHTKTACSANNINNNSQAQVPLLLRVMTTGTHIGKIYTGTVQER
ncbi:3-dehydroquinate synthase [Fragilariopsis cylindrus CCMP1102]|uniref:3-dehydroquinate synthase n=1 Tax=Fragilariopsis cylindrus CCMP1102 TaxID=635003 RepID=A0A1E7FZT6_9STRA|nr:3-dehydroquinate synthase [Fragilariopsis cylindrus CCMP1102]|eukprot:OEU23668.1 3-dehydroquinate synthase [Fragilariopsis cylindrus CCMP1102]